MLDWYNQGQGGEDEGNNSNNNGNGDNGESPIFSIRKLDWNGLTSNTKGNSI
jgi:hypothetical protein